MSCWQVFLWIREVMIRALNRKPLMLMQILSARYFRYLKITGELTLVKSTFTGTDIRY